jgi:hypothetical protein
MLNALPMSHHYSPSPVLARMKENPHLSQIPLNFLHHHRLHHHRPIRSQN